MQLIIHGIDSFHFQLQLIGIDIQNRLRALDCLIFNGTDIRNARNNKKHIKRQKKGDENQNDFHRDRTFSVHTSDLFSEFSYHTIRAFRSISIAMIPRCCNHPEEMT